MTKKIILAAVAAVGMVFGTATAHADTTDDRSYADLLSSQGIPFTSVARAREAGLAICVALESGLGMDLVVTEVMRSSPFTRGQAHQAAIDAEVVYCPQAESA